MKTDQSVEARERNEYMIKSKDNYPKAIAVYEAVLQLIHEERGIQNVTVSEIAKKAGIGKGTTYDYFESKEEIIAKALIYGYGKMINCLLEKTSECLTLKEKIVCLYDVVERFGNTNTVIETALKMVRKPEQMKEHICDAFAKDRIHVGYYDRLIGNLTETARNEGLISENASDEYVLCVMYLMVQAIINRNGSFITKDKMITKEQYLDYIYQMIIVSLSTVK